ncbi:uncharacterized protein LOC109853786 isoform X1 [Pseudomyrmex gracilis]|uniref:uncharacterized protein LOC109853786 isoform X1 n=1 Tax=Pseudomyrmex gracilis TaxID=219809 RepID=UPI0009957E0A|nr:uncharacterized protein LOC109853786 isoform X1 [Pseudomyrmex gracilis]
MGVGEDRGWRVTQCGETSRSRIRSQSVYTTTTLFFQEWLLPSSLRVCIFIIQRKTKVAIIEMCRKIEILLITSTLVLTVHSDYVFKCYMCTSLTNEGCDYAMSATSSLHPVECTKNNMIHWQRIILQNKQLNPFAKIFDADMPNYTYHQNIPLACAKVILNVENQEKPVTIRTCQTAKTENIDPCKTINQKLKENSLGIMEQCSLCVKDACNDSIVLSSEIIYILATLLGILMHVAFYSWA